MQPKVKAEGGPVEHEDQKYSVGFHSAEDIKSALPSFLKEDNLRDAEGRRPSDPMYDDTTVYIPKDYWNELTGAKI